MMMKMVPTCCLFLAISYSSWSGSPDRTLIGSDAVGDCKGNYTGKVCERNPDVSGKCDVNDEMYITTGDKTALEIENTPVCSGETSQKDFTACKVVTGKRAKHGPLDCTAIPGGGKEE